MASSSGMGYNTTYHTAIKTTPYEIMYLPRESNIELVDRNLIKREVMLKVIKFHLKRAQERIVDRHRSNRRKNQFNCVTSYLHCETIKKISISLYTMLKRHKK